MIQEKIEEKSDHEAISEFLTQIFMEELNHRSEGKGWRYGDIYDSLIEKHSEEFQEGQ